MASRGPAGSLTTSPSCFRPVTVPTREGAISMGMTADPVAQDGLDPRARPAARSPRPSAGAFVDRRLGDAWMRAATTLGAVAVVVLMGAIAVTMLAGALPALARFGPRFLLASDWDPVREQFGALPSLVGTVVSSALALAMAVPLAIAIATFLSELAPPALGAVVSTGIEMLAGIPSIIFGMWGLFVLAPPMAEHVQPWLGRWLGFLPLFRGPAMGIGMHTAALVLALMVVPYIAAVSRELFRMVPVQVREAAQALGATRWEVLWRVVIPYTRSGLVGAVVLGLGRALGETMAVTFVIGNSHRLGWSLMGPSSTIASTLANELLEATGELHVASLMALGLMLFGATLAILGLGRALVVRVAEHGARA
jgi:phosphate transport system permease protein